MLRRLLVPRGRMLLGALMVVVAGCAAPPPRNDRESWSCERTPDGSDWACSPQPSRYRAEGASAVVTNNAGHAQSRQIARDIPTGIATTANELADGTAQQTPDASRPMPARGAPGQAGWRAALPLLSAGVAEVSTVPGPSSTEPEARRPPPEPEPVLARWEKAAAAAKTASGGKGQAPGPLRESEKAHAAKRRPVSAVRPVAEPSLPEIGSRRIYTVQIGAFTTDQAARAYIAFHGLGKLPALAVAREMRGLNEYTLITFGRFEGPKVAAEAWRGSGAPRGLEVWVRPVTAVPRASPEVTRAAD